MWGGSRLRDHHLKCFNWTVFSSPQNEQSTTLSTKNDQHLQGQPYDVF